MGWFTVTFCCLKSACTVSGVVLLVRLAKILHVAMQLLRGVKQHDCDVAWGTGANSDPTTTFSTLEDAEVSVAHVCIRASSNIRSREVRKGHAMKPLGVVGVKMKTTDTTGRRQAHGQLGASVWTD